MKRISTLNIILVVMALALVGGPFLVLRSIERGSNAVEFNKTQAFYEVQAGLEYALKEIDLGGYPIVKDKVLGEGSFTTNIIPSERKISVIGSSSELQDAHYINVLKLGGDCLNIDTSGLVLGGDGNTDVSGITVTKRCLSGVSIASMTFTSEPASGDKVKKVTFDSKNVYEDSNGLPFGSALEIKGYKISDSSPHAIDLVRFFSDMSGKKIQMTLTLTDLSSVTTELNFMSSN